MQATTKKTLGWLSVCLGLFLFCRGRDDQQQDHIVIAASIAPLADLCKQVGGDRVTVFTLVPPGANPHTFELTPEQMRRLADTRLLVLNGIGLEYWADKVIDNFQTSALQVVWASEGIPVLQDEDHAAGNPHVWLNPLFAKIQMEKIAAALIQLDSPHASVYATQRDRFGRQLLDLDREITAQVASWQNISFICFHPSWNYFAERYGLVQAAVIEKRPGFEPTPKETMEIIETAKRLHTKAIFAEQQFPMKTSELIARECDARVLVLDPLGSYTANYSYLALLRANVEQMALALK